MSVRVRPLAPADSPAVAALAAEFADYLRVLGDSDPHHLTAAVIQRDGFGPRAAFAGLVAAGNEAETGAPGLAGYLLYHLGYDADLAARNLHVIDLYVSPAARVCRAVGGAYLFWAVFRPNRLAADFYAALGARAVPELDFMFVEPEALG